MADRLAFLFPEEAATALVPLLDDSDELVVVVKELQKEKITFSH